MMTRLLFFSFVLFFGTTFYIAAEEVVVDFSEPRFAQLDAEGKELLSEYARAYPKVKKLYENMRMDASVRETNYSSKRNLESLRSALQSEGLNEDAIKDIVDRLGQTDIQYEVRYRQSDGYFRVDTKINHFISDSMCAKLPPGSPLQNSLHGNVVQTVRIVLLTPTMGYELSKNDSSKQYFSLNAKRNLKKPDSEYDIGLPLMYFETAPFSSNNTPLEEVVFRRPPLSNGDPYVVEYVRQREVDNEHVIEIKVANADFADVFREIKLDRNSGVVKEIYRRTGLTRSSGEEEIRWYRETCTYDGIVDGVPLLKTYQGSWGKYDKNAQEDKIIEQIQCEVTNLVPGPVDLSEFDVAQFLPPGVKIGEITPAGFSTARIIAIVIGILLVLFGIYMKIRIMLREKRNTKP